MTSVKPRVPVLHWTRVAVIVVAGIVALLPLVGAPMPLAWLAAGLPGTLFIRASGIRLPLALTAASTLVFFAMIAVLTVTAVVPVDALLAQCLVFAVFAVVGSYLVAVRSESVGIRRPLITWRLSLTAVAPLVGSIVWIGVRLVSAWIPGSTQVAWATQNDAGNSLMFGRQIIIDGGVRLGVTENPVPFVASIIASMTLPGRPADGAVAAHDIFAFVTTWTLVIAALCLAVGLLCRQLLPEGTSASVSILGPALASLLPLSWMISGLSIEYGYINVAPTLLLLVGSLIAFFAARESPSIAFAVIVASGMLMMTSWSPLTLMPVLLAVATLGRHWRGLWDASVRTKALLAALLGLALVFALVFVLPTYGASKDAIESDVSFYPFRIRHLLVLGAVGGVLAIVLWWKRRDIDAMLALASIAVGGGAALAVFLYARRGEAQLWAYYPYKALWFLLMILLIVVVVYAVAVIADLAKRAWVGVLSLIAVGIGTIAYGAYANNVQGYVSMNAVERVLSGEVLVDNEGDAVWTRILDVADSEPHGLLWHTTDPNQGFINFWLIKLASPGFDNQELHVLAYMLDQANVSDLCRFAETTGPALTVITEDDEVAADIEVCGNPELVVDKR